MKFIKALILTFYLFTNVVAIGQTISQSISFPLFSYQFTNVSAFKNEINKNYFNDFYLPNFRYEMTIKDKYVFGMEHYHFYSERQGRPDPRINQIRALQINSYSLLLGINMHLASKLTLKIGTGLSYHNSWIGEYIDYNPDTSISSHCFKSKKVGLVLWSSIDYLIFKSFFIRMSLRYNPMFTPFDTNQGTICNGLQEHDRINYGIGQFGVGYNF